MNILFAFGTAVFALTTPVLLAVFATTRKVSA
jgi:hypothetical protein